MPESAGVEPANDNSPILKLRYVGDRDAAAQVLARILVRRAWVAEESLKCVRVANRADELGGRSSSRVVRAYAGRSSKRSAP